MNMNLTTKSMIAAVLGLGFLAAMPVAALAQPSQDTTNGVQNTIIQNLNLEQADIRDALKVLFKNVGVSYTVDPDVQGSVTASLNNVPFETALQNLLKQVDATYRIEGGIYNIIKKENNVTVTSTTEEAPQTQTTKVRLVRLKIMHADPYLVYLLLTGHAPLGVGPEISGQSALGGFGGGGGGGGGRGGFGGGGFGGQQGGFGGGGMGGFGGGGMGGFGGGGGGFGGGGFGGGGFGGGGGYGGGGGGFGGGGGIRLGY